MVVYLVNFTIIGIETDEKEILEKPFLVERESLAKVEEKIASYALDCNCTYVINNVRYLGVGMKM